MLSWATNLGEGTRSTSIPMKKSGKFDPISVCFWGRRATLRRKLFGNQRVLFDLWCCGYDRQNTFSSKVSNGNEFFLRLVFKLSESRWRQRAGESKSENSSYHNRDCNISAARNLAEFANGVAQIFLIAYNDCGRDQTFFIYLTFYF